MSEFSLFYESSCRFTKWESFVKTKSGGVGRWVEVKLLVRVTCRSKILIGDKWVKFQVKWLTSPRHPELFMTNFRLISWQTRRERFSGDLENLTSDHNAWKFAWTIKLNKGLEMKFSRKRSFERKFNDLCSSLYNLLPHQCFFYKRSSFFGPVFIKILT